MAKLLQINVDANNGSNGSIARDIGDLVIERGWDSYIAYGRRQIPSMSKLIRVGNDADVLMHGIESRLFDNHGLASRRITKKFLQKVEDIKPDIIHLHNIHGYYINYKYIFEYISENDIPIVWTLHDCWPFTGHCAYPISHGCNRYADLCHNCPARSGYPKSMLFDFSSRNHRIKRKIFTLPRRMIVTTVSNWLHDVTSKSFLKKYPIETVYDGIDTECFIDKGSDLRSRLRLENKFVLIAAAASWSISKGWNDYIKLSKLLPDDIKIVLVGVDKNKVRELPSQIISIPRVEGKAQLAEYYSMADVLLNLSYAETFGMTTAEAMACGTPGISYNRTACPELLSPETGIVVEAGNFNQILSAIHEIKANGKIHYSSSCRKRVIDNFDFKTVNKRFLEIYDALLKN